MRVWFVTWECELPLEMVTASEEWHPVTKVARTHDDYLLGVLEALSSPCLLAGEAEVGVRRVFFVS